MSTLVYKHTESAAESMTILSKYCFYKCYCNNVLCCFFYFKRLILIAEKKEVYEKFATPLINRLEKHFLLTSSVLDDWQKEVLRKFEAWISQFCETRYSKECIWYILVYYLLCMLCSGERNSPEEMLSSVSRRTPLLQSYYKLLTFSEG